MTSVVIEKNSTRESEELLVREAATKRNWTISDVPLKALRRGHFDTTVADLVIGTVPFVAAALRQRGLDLPQDDCYPVCLRSFLSRSVKLATLGQAKAALEDMHPAVFVKPATRTKRFTGFVLEYPFDMRVADVPSREPIWLSEVVEWRSEWRCYVSNHEIAHMSYCSGGRDAEPDFQAVRLAIESYAPNGAPSGYAMDVGVLADGRTALIEVNDGYSLGAYEGLAAETYFDLMLTRWREMTALELNIGQGLTPPDTPSKP